MPPAVRPRAAPASLASRAAAARVAPLPATSSTIMTSRPSRSPSDPGLVLTGTGTLAAFTSSPAVRARPAARTSRSPRWCATITAGMRPPRLIPARTAGSGPPSRISRARPAQAPAMASQESLSASTLVSPQQDVQPGREAVPGRDRGASEFPQAGREHLRVGAFRHDLHQARRDAKPPRCVAHFIEVGWLAADELEGCLAGGQQRADGTRPDPSPVRVSGVGELGRHVEPGDQPRGDVTRRHGAVRLHLDLA